MRKQADHFYANLLSGVIAVLVLFMICVGAGVTNTGSGDAEPTWTLKFWEWFFWFFGSDDPQVRYELGHRMLGTVIGFLTMALVFLQAFVEPRPQVKRFAYLCLFFVILMGILGAVRVRLGVEIKAGESPNFIQQKLMDMTGGGEKTVELCRRIVATVHGSLAHLTFGFFCAMTLLTSRNWNNAESFPSDQSLRLKKLCRLTLIFVFIQIVFGAGTRHFHGVQHALYTHLSWAMVVVIHAVLIAIRASRHHYEVWPIRQPAGLLVFMVIFQSLLGLVTWAMVYGQTATAVAPVSFSNLIRTLHVATGSMILAMTLVITMRAYKLLK